MFLTVMQIFWLMLIFYGAPARLPPYDTTPSACPSYTLVNLNLQPPLRLQTDILVHGPGLVDLCCGPHDDPCFGPDGLYLQSKPNMTTGKLNLYRLLQ